MVSINLARDLSTPQSHLLLISCLICLFLSLQRLEGQRVEVLPPEHFFEVSLPSHVILRYVQFFKLFFNSTLCLAGPLREPHPCPADKEGRS